MRCTVWKNKTVLLLCACLLLSCCGCAKTEKKSVSFFAMDTLMQITAYGGADDALSEARAVIEALDKTLDATDPQSALSQLKNGDTLPQTILTPLRTVQTIAAATDGALDATLYPLSDAWGFYTKDYRVPPQTELQTRLQNRGSFSVRNDILSCVDGTKLDLGCVAKGYAADAAARKLRQSGVQSAVLSLGGNVQTIGKKPDGSYWRISVADPLHPDGTVCDLFVDQTAVVTSGSYQRSFTQNGKTYHHILDPATGAPAQSGLLSVTVVCSEGAVADGLSTALFVLGLDRGTALWKKGSFPMFEALWITEDREIYVTPGLAKRMEQTNETYNQAITIE